MTRIVLMRAHPIALWALATWLVATPVAAQHRNPATADRAEPPPQAAPAPERAVPRAEPPSTSGPNDTGATDSGTTDSGSGRNGSNGTEKAAPRTGPPPTGKGGGTTIVVPGYGYGGYGYGGYDGGYYDPYDPERGYPDPAMYPGIYEEGKLRLKINPKRASVYIDGYYTGVVDDFDGLFQRLRIEAGPHRVDVHEPGFEPLTFNVRIEPRQTTTYRGEMKKLP